MAISYSLQVMGFSTRWANRMGGSFHSRDLFWERAIYFTDIASTIFAASICCLFSPELAPISWVITKLSFTALTCSIGIVFLRFVWKRGGALFAQRISSEELLALKENAMKAIKKAAIDAEKEVSTIAFPLEMASYRKEQCQRMFVRDFKNFTPYYQSRFQAAQDYPTVRQLINESKQRIATCRETMHYAVGAKSPPYMTPKSGIYNPSQTQCRYLSRYMQIFYDRRHEYFFSRPLRSHNEQSERYEKRVAIQRDLRIASQFFLQGNSSQYYGTLSAYGKLTLIGPGYWYQTVLTADSTNLFRDAVDIELIPEEFTVDYYALFAIPSIERRIRLQKFWKSVHWRTLFFGGAGHWKVIVRTAQNRSSVIDDGDIYHTSTFYSSRENAQQIRYREDRKAVLRRVELNTVSKIEKYVNRYFLDNPHWLESSSHARDFMPKIHIVYQPFLYSNERKNPI